MTAEALESVPAAIRIAAGDLGCSLPDGMRGISGTLEGDGAGLFWSRSYFACSVGGASPEVLLKNIANQTNE